MEILNAETVALYNRILIEASAGTGKTYTISLLYLRLLLGLRQTAKITDTDPSQAESLFAEPLTVEQILVVTFTNAATEELRERIRLNINELLIDCIRYQHSPELTSHSRFLSMLQLLQRHDKLVEAQSRLLLAQQQIDLASIYTINGFCSRVLMQQALGAGRLFEETMLEDETQLIKQVVNDFWRRYCYAFADDLFNKILTLYQTPTELTSAIRPYLTGDIPHFMDEHAGSALGQSILNSREEKLIELNTIYATEVRRIRKLKAAWLAQQSQQKKELDVDSLIVNSGINLKSYAVHHRTNWINKVTAWAESDVVNEPPTDIAKFRQSVLNEKTAENKTPPQAELFELIDQYLDTSGEFERFFFKFALLEIRHELQSEKDKSAQMGFSDQIIYLDQAISEAKKAATNDVLKNDALKNNGLKNNRDNENLITQIRQQFPVALIDEFQDTDPQQYRIFSTVYSYSTQQNDRQSQSTETSQINRESSSTLPAPLLLLIGDPKQAIYAFRGADIFTYMVAKNEVDARYTLNVNYRSAPQVVEAVNTLFQSHAEPFSYDAIPFYPVEFSEKNQASCFYVEGKAQAGVEFYSTSETPEERFNKSQYQKLLANYSAKRIATWLNAADQQKAWLHTTQGKKVLTLDDIVILVRDRFEAAEMKQALYQYDIHSAFVSKTDSVFDTEIANDMLILLQAIHQENDERLIRTAIGLSLFNLSHSELVILQQDESEWEGWLERFRTYRIMWAQTGTLALMRHLLSEHQLVQRWQGTGYSERWLMDYLHISELLQQESTKFESLLELLYWFNEQIQSNVTVHEAQQLRLESDKNVIQIMTIHASKGLEFPIVMLPFLASAKTSKQGNFVSYYSLEQQQRVFETRSQQKAEINYAIEQAEKEIFAEYQRLLYVALTRAVYHLAIGVVPIFDRTMFVLPNTALGHLILANLANINLKNTNSTHLNSTTNSKEKIKYTAEHLFEALNILNKKVAPHQSTKVSTKQSTKSSTKLSTTQPTAEVPALFNSSNISLSTDEQLVEIARLSRKTHTEQEKLGLSTAELLEVKLSKTELSETQAQYQAREFTSILKDNWRLSSYTQMIRPRFASVFAIGVSVQSQVKIATNPLEEELAKYITTNTVGQKVSKNLMSQNVPTQNILSMSLNGSASASHNPNVFNPIAKSVFNFPRGAFAGSFLHSLLEKIDFYLRDWQAQCGSEPIQKITMHDSSEQETQITQTALFKQFVNFAKQINLSTSPQTETGTTTRTESETERLIEWSCVLYEWLNQIVCTPLPVLSTCDVLIDDLRTNESISNLQTIDLQTIDLQTSSYKIGTVSLSQINERAKLHEMQFHIPIKQRLTADVFNQVIQDEDRLSQQAISLSFEAFEGLLQGFIDLVFEHNGKYFVLDYKSNWLGDSTEDYHQANLDETMIAHRYDVQYQIYTLALHRYLKQRLKHYDYDQHIGGVYYLFIRGMGKIDPLENPQSTNTYGIFYTKPSKSLIEKLETLIG